jgi:hypothetical protein
MCIYGGMRISKVEIYVNHIDQKLFSRITHAILQLWCQNDWEKLSKHSFDSLHSMLQKRPNQRFRWVYHFS